MSGANPKAIVFFGTLFPLFMNAELAWLPQLAVLGTTFLVLDGFSLVTYAGTAGRLRLWLRRTGRDHLESRVTGSLLIGAGLALAFKRIS